MKAKLLKPIRKRPIVAETPSWPPPKKAPAKTSTSHPPLAAEEKDPAYAMHTEQEHETPFHGSRAGPNTTIRPNRMARMLIAMAPCTGP
jgi:hypothetical protein